MNQDPTPPQTTEQLLAENAALAERVETLENQLAIEARARRVLKTSAVCCLTATQVMTPDPGVAHLGDSLQTVLMRFAEGGFRRLPVLDESGALVGIITDRDVRLAINSPLVMHERWQDETLLEQTQVDVCMTPDPIFAAPETPVYELARVMRTRKIGGLPILEDGEQLVGIVTETDLLKALETLLRAVAEEM